MPTTEIEGLYWRRRAPHWNHGKTLYSSIIEVGYEGKLLDYIFEPIYKGPNGEKYIAGIRAKELDDSRLPSDVCEENWYWYSTIDEAAKFIWTREFSSKL